MTIIRLWSGKLHVVPVHCLALTKDVNLATEPSINVQIQQKKDRNEGIWKSVPIHSLISFYFENDVPLPLA